MDLSLTIPAAGTGVWPGAAVLGPDLYADGVTAAFVVDGSADEAVVACRSRNRWSVGRHRIADLYIDLTHRPTRLEVMARLAERKGVPDTLSGPEEVAALAIVCQHVFGGPS